MQVGSEIARSIAAAIVSDVVADLRRMLVVAASPSLCWRCRPRRGAQSACSHDGDLRRTTRCCLPGREAPERLVARVAQRSLPPCHAA